MTIELKLPEEVQKQLLEKARKSGCSVEAYLQRMVREHLDLDLEGEAPPSLKPRSREELEQMIEEGMKSPSREMTKSDWDRLHSELGQLAARKKAKAVR